LILHDFLAIFGCKRVNLTKWMEIDYDYLRTGTAVGFRASCELCSNYLFLHDFVLEL